MFGVEEASSPDLHHSGSGKHYALNISTVMNEIRSLPNWKEKQLDISIEPTQKTDQDTYVKVGRISLYSQ